jgi:hypothetical protein
VPFRQAPLISKILAGWLLGKISRRQKGETMHRNDHYTKRASTDHFGQKEGVCSLYSSVHQSTDFEPVKVQETLELTA